MALFLQCYHIKVAESLLGQGLDAFTGFKPLFITDRRTHACTFVFWLGYFTFWRDTKIQIQFKISADLRKSLQHYEVIKKIQSHFMRRLQPSDIRWQQHSLPSTAQEQVNKSHASLRAGLQLLSTTVRVFYWFLSALTPFGNSRAPSHRADAYPQKVVK